jgi:hypothetical protein
MECGDEIPRKLAQVVKDMAGRVIGFLCPHCAG